MKLALVGPELEENLALRYIHAAAAAGGNEPAIFDFHEAAQIDDLAGAILAFAPEVVGLSMVFTARAGEYVNLANTLRQRGYRGHITAGGHFACFHAAQLLREFRSIDSILHGEGERAISDLMANLARPGDVAGITWRDPAGRIMTTPARPTADDLDALPFPTRPDSFHCYYDLPIANILSGRGCFANCDFCSINAWHRQIGGRRFRQRSVANIADEMARLYHDRGVRIYNFHDDNFFLPAERQNVERFSAIAAALEARGVGRIGIQVKARPDTVAPESMAILRKIGLFRVFLGVESNSVAGLKALGRGISIEQNHRSVELLKELGVHVTFNLLMFEPECTIADLRDNISFMAAQADVPLNFCRTEVYSGTALEARLRAAGRLQGDYFGYTYTMTHPRSQLAYELFRDVFTPRNFDLGGMNLRAMTVDYYFHILRHFYPRVATEKLRTSVKTFIRDLNANNIELLEEICGFAERADPPTGDGAGDLAAALSGRRIDFDATMARRADGLIGQMRTAALGRTSRRGALARASAAAAVVLVGSVGCDTVPPAVPVRGTPQTQPATSPRLERPESHPAEMAPLSPASKPATFPTHPAEMAPANLDRPILAAQIPDRDFDAAEMVAPDWTSGPSNWLPATAPTSQPATTQAALPALPADEAAKVQRVVSLRTMLELADLAKKHKMLNKRVTVDLELNAQGQVNKCTVQLPKDQMPEFQKELAGQIIGWTFPGVRTAGRCTATMQFTDFESHPTEMAPHPAEMAPRGLRRD